MSHLIAEAIQEFELPQPYYSTLGEVPEGGVFFFIRSPAVIYEREYDWAITGDDEVLPLSERHVTRLGDDYSDHLEDIGKPADPVVVLHVVSRCA